MEKPDPEKLERAAREALRLLGEAIGRTPLGFKCDRSAVSMAYEELARVLGHWSQLPRCTCTPEVGGRMRCPVCGGWPERVRQPAAR